MGVNVVLTRESFPRLQETLERARRLGACEAQLLRYKPAGRAASLDYLAQRLTAAPGTRLRRHAAIALAVALQRRDAFTCGSTARSSPSSRRIRRSPPTRGDSQRFGIFGCEAAGALAAVTSTGHVAPCSFAPATGLRGVDLADGHAHDEGLARWRAWVDAPDEPCASCTLRTVCKGGCKVVTSFVEGAHGPDPECPRVVDARRAAS